MKKIKYTFGLCLTLLLLINCADDDNNLDYIDQVYLAPENVSALFQVTQDNTGTVTITPNSDGAVSYTIIFGDDSEAGTVDQGNNIDHIYTEGTYTVTLEAVGITGLTSEASQDLVVSFNAPENLDVVIENDLAISKQVNVTVNADFAIMYDVYFGEAGNDTPVSGNIGSTLNYQYQDAGTYPIRIVVMGAAIETTEYLVDFDVTAILQPITGATLPPARGDADVVSVFSAAYNDIPGTDYFPDWGQGGQGSSWALFDFNGDAMLQYINLSYQGIQFGSPAILSEMEFMHFDVWTPDEGLRIETSLISLTNGEKPVWSDLTANEWTSIEIPISAWTDQGLTVGDIHQLKFVGDPWAAGTVFIDNVYFWKAPAPASGVEGVWKMASEDGSLGVGPTPGDVSWFNCNGICLTDRACYFDDTYVFAPDGSFYNVQGSDTWVETWQGAASEGCGAPIAPHDGSADATYLYDDGGGTITITGTGAYIGIPKPVNAGELPGVAVPGSITYNVTLTDNNNTMNVVIEAGGGVFWQYKLIRYTSPLVGSWKMANEDGSLGVGPTPGDVSWFNCNGPCLTDRACYFDDSFVFGADGSFTNEFGADTWVEAWQGAAGDGCGAPIAPHDGSGVANFVHDESAGKLTVNGTGAFIGIPKPVNAGELPGVAVPDSITYDITFLDADTISVFIEAGGGVFWQYKLVRE